MQFENIRTVPEFNALMKEWNNLLAKSAIHVPFLRHEFLSGWWQTLGGGEWPNGELHIVTARNNNALLGIAPLFFTTNRDGLPALMLLGSIEISDFLDVITPDEHVETFFNGLLDHLEATSPEWRILDWYNILSDSPTLAALDAAANRKGWKYVQEPYLPCPYILIPGDWERYLVEQVEKKQRHEIRRKMRRIEEFNTAAEQNGSLVGWYIVEDGGQLEAEVDAFLALMEQDPKKARFLTPPMRAAFQSTAHVAFDNGWLQLAFMTVGGEKAAGYFNFDYDNRIWVYNSGIDYRFREYSPGWVLLGYLLQWANEHKHTAFDFMRGDEDYKYKFGAVNRQVLRVQVKR